MADKSTEELRSLLSEERARRKEPDHKSALREVAEQNAARKADEAANAPFIELSDSQKGVAIATKATANFSKVMSHTLDKQLILFQKLFDLHSQQYATIGRQSALDKTAASKVDRQGPGMFDKAGAMGASAKALGQAVDRTLFGGLLAGIASLVWTIPATIIGSAMWAQFRGLDVGGAFEGVANVVRGVVNAAFTVTRFGSQIANGIVNIASRFGRVAGTMARFARVLARPLATLAKFVGGKTLLAPIFMGIDFITGYLKSWREGPGGVMGFFKASFDGLVNMIVGFFKPIGDLASWIDRSFMGSFFTNMFGDLSERMSQAVRTSIDLMMAPFNLLNDWVTDWSQRGMAFFGEGGGASRIIDDMMRDMQVIFDGLQSAIEMVINYAKQKVEGFLDAVTTSEDERIINEQNKAALAEAGREVNAARRAASRARGAEVAAAGERLRAAEEDLARLHRLAELRRSQESRGFAREDITSLDVRPSNELGDMSIEDMSQTLRRFMGNGSGGVAVMDNSTTQVDQSVSQNIITGDLAAHDSAMTAT